ncbi:aminoglycoside phosphotransferase family protein [Brachybacterium sacelli]|uniref:Streptomycin 6-kinase n=1 Tax=Brachybacterium sacelli TaxID=173364 RepID=A0ABS4X3P8_9MICO|nr:aminoglycoside phosphotransferase family protein [Brachybacterium sacelli]MBP2383098.1 streptomycin 6-kinase [Brachybacterium sacelli]
MGTSVEIDPAFGDRLLRQDASVRPWLDTLPQRVAESCRAWRLRPDGEARFGGTSLVIPVRTAGDAEAALKLVSPLADAGYESRALAAFAGHGVVGLLRADEDAGALLLERLAPPALAAHGSSPLEAARVAGSVADRLAVVPAPPEAPRLRDLAEDWLEQLHGQHAEATAVGSAVPEEVFARAARAVESLATDDSSMLTHGDLSLENILRRRDGSWCAIDPVLLRGPVEYEAHTVVRSMLARLLAVPAPLAALRDMHQEFCRAARADAATAWELSLARFVASAYWESQHGGEVADVGRLWRTVTLLTPERW